MSETIVCPKCKGIGSVEMSLDLKATLCAFPESGGITASSIHELLGSRQQLGGIGITGINNRLRSLADSGFIKEVGKQSREILWERVKPIPQSSHVDDWLDNVRYVADPVERYVRLYLEIARMPAVKKWLYEEFVNKPITCEYQGVRRRLTGASRLGDVFLNADLNETSGYTVRVCVTDCENWKVEGL